jgi:N-acylglucosamine-6-phosphate 2-epimerase
MTAMARAAARGEAAGIRANGRKDIQAIRQQVSLPVIGILKSYDATGDLWITATFEEAAVVALAGADIIAVDSRRAERPDGTRLNDLFDRIHDELGLPVMADIAAFDQAARAERLGADLVATTFAIEARETPDFDLLRRLTDSISVPVVAEGLYWTPSQVCKALEFGAHAVVVGSAITRPDEIALRFVKAIRAQSSRTWSDSTC